MIMTTAISHRLLPLILVCAAALAAMGCGSPVLAQAVVVMVNGEPITNYDIEQRSKLNFLSTHKMPARQDVINELIDEKVKIKEAKKFTVDPTNSDIDQAYNSMSSRMHIAPEQLTKMLDAQGIRPDTMKQRLRAEMVWSSLVRGRFKESLQVGEKEVAAAAAAVEVKGSDDKQEADSFEYKMQPIVLIVPRGSAPAFVEARHKEAESLRNRV
jgi:peptidyl-prolyl cis-trans isomerase SurA